VTSSFTVRLARDDELDAAGALVAEAYLTQPDMDATNPYLDHVRDVRGRASDVDVLVAVGDDGRLIGCVSYVRDHTSSHAEVERPGEAGFRMLGVAPVDRGRGVGRALVAACVERARAAGCSRLAISTSASWVDAQRLYERVGFRRARERDFDPVPGVSLWVYVLDL
jgi:ribosomal protein S18 acetylase RimI-like enzyme